MLAPGTKRASVAPPSETIPTVSNPSTVAIAAEHRTRRRPRARSCEDGPVTPAPGPMSASPQILIVGAGFGGIAAAIELRRHGFEDLTILESAPELGGTWFYNDYPGAACDVPSHMYSFSFAQRRTWSRLCSPRQEILDYLREVVDDHGIRPLIRFSQAVANARFDEAGARWQLTTDTGETYDADAVILATRQLNRPAIPRLPGLDRFAGHSFHSARWDHDYDLAGKRVAVV